MKSFFSKVMDIFDTVRKVTINLIFLLFILIFVVTLFSAGPQVPDNSVLVFNPKGALVEQLVRPSADSFPFAFPSQDQDVLPDVVRALELAANDPKIRMLRLDLEGMKPTSLAKLQDVRKAIETFRKSGKQVVASGHAYSQSQYYLAATADMLYLHPLGQVELTGFSAYRNYFKSALDKLDVDIHLFRAGEYKSAGEPLVRDDMSDAAREENKAWLATLWEAYKNDIADMRGVEAARIQTVLDQPTPFLAEHGGNLARLLKAENLVDELGDKIDADAYIESQLGVASAKKSAIGYKAYLKASTKLPSEPDSPNLIGVVTASGPIVSGEQPTGTVGSDTVAGLLQKAAEDDRIKAVVLRVDSPGGSALASEVIRREVERVKEAGKPVVVSMGSLAASGGYWISATADEIWAQPTTLTGSIGVFGIVANIHRGLEKLGIHTDGLGTTNIAGGLRSDMPLNPELARSIQMGVDDIYRRFIGHVSEGRKLEAARVDQLAQGRVWSGEDAQKLGLVDELGDLDAAIKAAAARAGVANDYRRINVEPHMDFADFFVENMLSDLDARFGLSWTAKLAALPGAKTWLDGLQGLELLTLFNDPNQVYAYHDLPY